MADVATTLEHLLRDRDDGRLAELCRTHGVELLVLFGSARHRPETAQDVDIAYAFRHGLTGDDLAVVNALGEAYGDALDIMPLDRAGVVARYAALGDGEPLVELVDGTFANNQMAAFGIYCDTQKLRDATLELLAQ